MAAEVKIFISHATQDVRDLQLAQKLARGLRSFGAKVWIALDSIPAGEQWEPALVSALLEGCTHYLVILSATSTQSPWVLKEIALARERHGSGTPLKILPLRTGRLPAFEGDDFLARFQDVPYEEPFSAQLRRVAAALALPPALPNPFRLLIEEVTRHFVGRETVFASLQRFIANERKGCFAVLGDPGEGKTTLLAEYVRRTGCPAHFNIATQGINTTEQFYESIRQQLGERYDVAPSTRPGESPSFSLLVSDLLHEAALARPPGEPLVLVIDALDEVKAESSGAGVNVLQLPQVLPDGVFLLLSTRRKEVPFVTRERLHPCDLAGFPAENRRDVERYLARRLEDPAFEPWLRRRGWPAERAVTELADRSENNFMYLHYVLAELRAGAFDDASQPLPTGLKGYYRNHWHRMGMEGRPDRLKLSVLYVLSLMRAPISLRVLAEIVRADAVDVRPVIKEWREFLHAEQEDGEVRYRLYHSSFREFLHSPDALGEAGDADVYRSLITDYGRRKLFA
jgi:hypothetical protein